MKIDRRGVLGAAGVLAGAAATNAKAAENKKIKFLHGIASGDPLQDRVILWTRVTPELNENSDIWVDWEIATDAGFKKLVGHGKVKTNPSFDYTVKVDATDLKANEKYFYRFRCGDIISPIGMTQTLPMGKVEEFNIVAISCSHYACGFYNAYKEIAKLSELDVVLHLGDYIYEYGTTSGEYGADIGSKIGRLPTPSHETISLEDYRERYACYRLDPDLQAAHARAPWICVWDDHETANDDWVDGAQNHQPNEGDWKIRAKASVLAYYEWIPIREPEKGKRPEAINRVFEIGNLATLIMMENRLVGRSRQINLENTSDVKWQVYDNSDTASPKLVTDSAKTAEIMTIAAGGKTIPSPYSLQPDYDSLRKSLNNSERTVFGFDQEKWLEQEITKSVKSNKSWQIIGNEVVMGNTIGVDIPGYLGKTKWDAIFNAMPPKMQHWIGTLANMPKDIPYDFDGWNGYPAARQRVKEIFKTSGAHVAVLSGDSHAFWLNELNDKNGEIIAAEIGTTAISSTSIGNALNDSEIGPAYVDSCKEILFCNQLTRGFSYLKVTPEEIRVDLVGVSTVLSRDYNKVAVKSCVIKPKSGGGVERLKLI